MKAQYYKVKATSEHRQQAKSGTPVFLDNDSDDITGFVDFVSDVSMCIYLFEPGEVEFECEVLSAEVDPKVWQDRLNEIVMEDDEMHAFWSQVFGEVDDEG